MTRQINLDKGYGTKTYCRICSFTSDSPIFFVKHHITYFPENTLIVCTECHIKIHASWCKIPIYIKYRPPKGDSKKFYKIKEEWP